MHRKWFGSQNAERTPIVLLHEGLGSVSAWGSFPQRLAEATDRAVLAYDRPGYGRSSPNPPPWPANFMHLEAERLHDLLIEEGLEQPILVGHSDGATIALLYPSVTGRSVSAIVSLAAHVSVEERCVAGIARVVDGYREGLAKQLARHHDDADTVFAGWSEVWLSDRFRSWAIDSELAAVTSPVLAFQGTADTYATRAQLERVGAGVSSKAELVDLPGCDHWPHREATDTVLERITAFVEELELP